MTETYQSRERTFMMTPEQAAVFNEPTRTDIMILLAERPASVQQLAEAMGKPKGTVGYHVKVLADAGLIAVVRTRRVRAITEKFYGRLARTYVFPSMGEKAPVGHGFFLEAMAELRAPREAETAMVTLRHARIPAERLDEFAAEVIEIAERFAAEPRGGGVVYGFLAAMYPTDRPALKEDDQ
ncbi:MAG: winged helix-turn-helix domain-containing protein [Acidimicrobiia bacterium]|nr:MAG: winged helix-turn-helix domain-containing protein [Acidimicrobiia bacterium]